MLIIASLSAVTGSLAPAWDKTFPPSERVTVEKVAFKNRVLNAVVGDLYISKNIDKTKKHMAIVVGHPFDGVKEQTANLHAQKLAEMAT